MGDLDPPSGDPETEKNVQRERQRLSLFHYTETQSVSLGLRRESGDSVEETWGLAGWGGENVSLSC